MAFGAIITLLLFYFIRPQDWVGGMAGMNIVKPVVVAGIVGLMSRSGDEPRWRFMRSPHEWALAIFALFVVFTAPSPSEAFSDVMVTVTFAMLVLHAINTEERLVKFLRWWLFSLVVVLAMGVATRAGWDITNSRALIDQMKGRFCLNTWIFNNPNAFGHSMITVLPLSYYLLFYKGTMAKRLLALLLMVLAVWMIIPTESKGAFLAGGVGLTTVLMFGRKLWVQVVAILLIATFAGSAVTLLPRMEGMKNLRADEGVQGRLLAWQASRNVTLTKPNGVGYKQFHAVILWLGVMEEKATHSAYVQIGGDLGVNGLTIYLGMLLVCLRSVIQFSGLTDPMERCRRVLFALLVTFIVSGWMIDRAYHTELFLMIGAAGAYHQICIRQRTEDELELEADDLDADEDEMGPAYAPVPIRPRPSYAGSNTIALAMGSMGGATMALANAPSPEPEEEPELLPPPVRLPSSWTRLTVLDVLLAFAAGQGFVAMWDYVMKNI